MPARGRAQHDAARRHLHAFWNQGAGGDDGAAADAGTVEHDGADADQAIILDVAAVEVDRVGDGDAVAEHERMLLLVAVEDAVVLNVGFPANADRMHVAADHGVKPYAGVLPHHDVADDLGAILYESRGGDLGMASEEGLEHGKARENAGNSKVITHLDGWTFGVNAALKESVLAAARASGLALAGVAGVEPSAALALFPEWIASGRAGEMAYLARTGENGRYLREAVREAWPWAQSVLCAGVVYDAQRERSGAFAQDPDRGWISSYAWGADYHEVLRRRLEDWVRRIRGLSGAAEAQFHLTVDTAPLVEREAARQAGVGWQGKNTCVIHPQCGSFLFLGCVITSLALAPDTPVPDRCGSCRRCIEACPTHALEPYAMDASRCLAYLNIELRGTIPTEFRTAMGSNLVGCDICQEVCPWNGRWRGQPDQEFEPRPGMFAPLLAELAALTEGEYRSRFRHSAVRRIKYAGMKRNLAVAMGNSGNPAFAPVLQRWIADPDATVAEHAAWALERLGGGHSSSYCSPGDDRGPAGGRNDHGGGNGFSA